MTTLITDHDLEQRLQAERKATGADRYDEVWEGVYVMAPLANNEHQNLATRLASCISNAVGFDSEADIYAGVNVSDQTDDWTFNYRVPDVAVVLPGCLAQDRGTFIFGGPDFLIEIVSPNDRSLEKFDFYSKIGVRELLLIHRNPWSLDLYRLRDGVLKSAGQNTIDNNTALASSVLPLTFRLVSQDAQKRPFIEVVATAGDDRWRV